MDAVQFHYVQDENKYLNFLCKLVVLFKRKIKCARVVSSGALSVEKLNPKNEYFHIYSFFV